MLYASGCSRQLSFHPTMFDVPLSTLSEVQRVTKIIVRLRDNQINDSTNNHQPPCDAR